MSFSHTLAGTGQSSWPRLGARSASDRAEEAPLNFRMEPGRALRAFRRLVADKEDTGQVFHIMRALAGRSFPRGYARLLRTSEGGRQAALAVEFADRLHDAEWLRSLPEGSVGAAYRAFVAPRNLSAYGLAEESRKLPDADVDAQHPVAWYARRLRDVHDVWHVLTGYGADALGEVPAWCAFFLSPDPLPRVRPDSRRRGAGVPAGRGPPLRQGHRPGLPAWPRGGLAPGGRLRGPVRRAAGRRPRPPADRPPDGL